MLRLHPFFRDDLSEMLEITSVLKVLIILLLVTLQS